MPEDQKWIRLQVKGGTEFNFILPANPAWKVSTLADHMIKVYNQVTQHEISSVRASKVGSLKRNGFYVAPSLKVGNVFNDWDEVSCNIVLKKIDDQAPKPSKADIKIQKESKLEEEKSEKIRKLSEPKVETKKQEKKTQNKTNENKKEQSKQQKSDKSKTNDIMSMLELVRGSNKNGQNEKKTATQKTKGKQEENKKKQGNEPKKVAIVIQEESD